MVKNAPDKEAPLGSTPQARFPQWLARVDQAHALRESDPAEALRLIDGLRQAWCLEQAPERVALEARSAAVAANAHFWSGQAERARAELAHLFQHVQDALLTGADDQITLEVWRARRSGHNLRAMLASRLGDEAAAIQDFLAALHWARTVDDPRSEARVLVNLACVYVHIGLPARALELLHQALPMAKALGWHELAADIHHNAAAALGGCGRMEEAITSHRLAELQLADLGLAHRRVYALMALCERLLELGRIDEAASSLDQAVALVGAKAEAAVRCGVLQLQTRLAMARADMAQAAVLARRGLRLSLTLEQRFFEAQALLDLSRIEHSKERLRAARLFAERALAVLVACSRNDEVVRAHELLSRIAEADGDLPSALEHLKAHHRIDRQLASARSTLQAQVLMVEYQVERAQAEVDFHRLENTRLNEALAEIGQRLRSGGTGPLHPTRGPAGPQALQALGLTSREAEVLFWVIQGKTNADVMVILRISLPTVKKHLSRIYMKLQVENRTAASSVVQERIPAAADTPVLPLHRP